MQLCLQAPENETSPIIIFVFSISLYSGPMLLAQFVGQSMVSPVTVNCVLSKCLMLVVLEVWQES